MDVERRQESVIDVPVRVVGRGAETHVSVLWQIGVGVGERGLRQLWHATRQRLSAIDFGVDTASRVTPAGIVVDLVVERDDQVSPVCTGLHELGRDHGAPDEDAPPPRSPAELMDAIVFGGTIAAPASEPSLASAPTLVAITTGRSAHTDPVAYATSVRDRCQQALSRTEARSGPLIAASSSTATAESRWIRLPHQTSSVVRWYRELPHPGDTSRALARSIANACIGGTPSSRMFRLLSEQRRYSYNPSMYLRQVNGRQWMVADVATAAGAEALVEEELAALFERAIHTPPRRDEIEDAVRFMFTQKRVVSESPELSNVAVLAPFDGSDPWSLSEVTPAEAGRVSRDAIAEEARVIYGLTDLWRLVVSPRPEPADWAIR